jgi:hypothetical protein
LAVHVSVLSVATSGYLSHWHRLLASVERYFFPDDRVTMHVFTDDVEGAIEHQQISPRVVAKVHEVPSWGWPEATLLRFRAINRYASEISGDVACWLDADMLVTRDTGNELTPKSWANGLAFVHHPGYWRPKGSAQIQTWLKSPRTFASDLIWQLGGKKALGAWETNDESLAFVAPDQRHDYVCGGAWFGWTDRILQMSQVLEARTDEDLARGFIARWHDESHLNWYVAHNAVTLLGPEYCYEKTYPHLQLINPRIEAVNKGAEVGRVRRELNRAVS